MLTYQSDAKVTNIRVAPYNALNHHYSICIIKLTSHFRGSFISTCLFKS